MRELQNIYYSLSIFAVIDIVLCSCVSIVTEFQWQYLDYDWDSEVQKIIYISNGSYDYTNNIPVDVDRAEDGRTFITVSGGLGVPASLNTVSEKYGPSGPLLSPYPNWSWYGKNNCDDIVNVYRIVIDECNRLWVIDTGRISGEYVCPAQLLAFDLYTDKLIFRKKIPSNAAQDKYGNGLLYSLAVETHGHICNDTNVYIADARGYGLIVWNGVKIFRVDGNVYEPEAKYTIYSIAGEKFHLVGGVQGMALSPSTGPNGDRYLFFRPLSSRSMYAANTSELSIVKNRKKIKYYGNDEVLPSQASTQAFSSGGTLFYGLTKEIGIGCWHITKPVSTEYFRLALTDYERLQFISGMKVIRNQRFHEKSLEELLILSNRLQKFYGGTLNYNDINYRILKLPVDDLIGGTICDKS